MISKVSKEYMSIDERFRHRAEQKPEATALVFENREITYRELDERVNLAAAGLLGLGIGPGDIAAVDFQTPLEMATGILGIIKSGAVYLPVGSDTPDGYLQGILEKSGAGFRLTGRPEIPFTGKTLLWQHLEHLSNVRLLPRADRDPETLTAVIYEFQTMGNAEGICLSHRYLLDWIKFTIETLAVDFSRTLFIASPWMDNAFPLWLANLLAGGTVHFSTGADAFKRLEENDFTGITCSLGFLEDMISGDLHPADLPGNLRSIVSAGEEVFETGDFKTRLKEKNIRWHNYFGFPEMSMITTLVDHVHGEGPHRGHTGKMAPASAAYIIDREKKLVPAGISGELFVSGNGVFDGYYKNETLNRSHFPEVSALPEKKVFRTGYKSSWLPDWKVSILGRNDGISEGRLSINGCRVTAGAVEAALLTHPSVKDCIAAPVKNPGQKLHLTAYLVLEEECSYHLLEEHLHSIFPAALFPIGFVELSSLPVTNEGYPDRDYLEKTGYPDTLYAGSLEEDIKKIRGVEDTAVIIKGRTEKPPVLHVKDVLPQLGGPGGKPGGGNVREAMLSAANHNPGEVAGNVTPSLVQGEPLVKEEGDPETLSEALERAARWHKDNGTTYIRHDGSEHFQTYPQLLEEAQRILAGLRDSGLKPQDKVVFQLSYNDDFAPAFWACALGGFVPVPVNVPKNFAQSNNETKTLVNIWKTLDKPLVLTRGELKVPVHALLEENYAADIDELRTYPPDRLHHLSRPEDLAILLFTSGSTGNPKGVMQSHQNLLGREKSNSLANGFSDRDVSMNWMPLEHVGGVVMFHLKAVWNGCRQIQVKIDYILKNPLCWLDIITKHKATVTWAPNFAYTLVNERLEEELKNGPDEIGSRWDLSSMRFILNAGEAINAHSTAKFLRLLAPYGLSPAAMKPSWGMSETCSAVTYSHSFTPGLDGGVHFLDSYSPGGLIKKGTSSVYNSIFVELGKPIPGFSMRITDFKNRVVPEGMVGRIQVKGLSVTMGYYNNTELNREVFTSDGWFDTGDLGFILDRRMTITGRAKDVIIINGINYSNMEMEAAVEEVEGVETSFTAACATRDIDSDTEKIVVFFNSAFTDFAKLLEQIKKIRRKFVDQIGLKLDIVVPLNKEDIPKTSIGKIQRAKLVKLFEEGRFDEIIKRIDIGLENENTIPSWFFGQTWCRREQTLTTRVVRGKSCLLLEDRQGLADVLIPKLEAAGGRCIRVKIGSRFEKVNSSQYQVNIREEADFSRLLEGLSSDNITIGDIFHLYCYDGLEYLTSDIDRLKEKQERGVYSILRLFQALEKIRRPSPLSLFVVSGSSRVTSREDGSGYEYASLPGFLKTLPLEMPGVTYSYIDLELGDLSTNANHVLNEWMSSKMGPEIAYRNGERLVPKLTRLDIRREAVRDVPIEHGGIYLVTGGLGGLGSMVSRWLIKHFQARLILVGRTVLPPRTEWKTVPKTNSLLSSRIANYQSIESESRDFIYAEGDVCSEPFLQDALQQAESRWGSSLAGVFHLAGSGSLEYHWTVMEKHWVASERPETFETMYRAKMYGTLALHNLLKNKPDALFAAFSSTISLFGAATFCAYASANSFLDGFCRHRQNNGYPNTYCLNWSSWDDVGMSENNPENMKEAMESSGYGIIPVKQGLDSLLAALCSRPQQMVIGLNSTSRNIQNRLAEYPTAAQEVKVYYALTTGIEQPENTFKNSVMKIVADREMIKNAHLELHPVNAVPRNQGCVDYRQLEKMEKMQRVSRIKIGVPVTQTEKKLAKIWQDILKKNYVGVNDNFFESGGHSLNATVLVSRIQHEFNVGIQLGEVFQRPTIKEISDYIDTAAETVAHSIEPTEQKEYYVLSSAQKRLFIVQQLDQSSINYNIPQVVKIKGAIELERLQEAIDRLIRRHEIFRTAFIIVDQNPYQKVYEDVDFAVEYFEAGEDEAGGILENFGRPFVLTGSPPFMRVGVIRTGEDSHLLIIDMHHIISDGVSHGIFFSELMSLYAGEELPGNTGCYHDFAEWQHQEKGKQVNRAQERFWLEEFKNGVPRLNLPTDYPRPEVQDFSGKGIDIIIDKEETAALKQLQKEEGVTLFMLLLAVYNVFLFKLSGQEDIVVGVPIACRRNIELKHMIGMFVNMLPLMNYPAGGKTFRNFLREVKVRTLTAFDNQEYPFEDIVDKVLIERDPSRNPLFDVMFGVQNIDITGNRVPGVELEPYEGQGHQTARFDFIFGGVEKDGRLVFRYDYSVKLFKPETSERYVMFLKKLISSVLSNPEDEIKNLEMVTDEEKTEILSLIEADEQDIQIDLDI